jgi:hypothetical protein
MMVPQISTPLAVWETSFCARGDSTHTPAAENKSKPCLCCVCGNNRTHQQPGSTATFYPLADIYQISNTEPNLESVAFKTVSQTVRRATGFSPGDIKQSKSRKKRGFLYTQKAKLVKAEIGHRKFSSQFFGPFFDIVGK